MNEWNLIGHDWAMRRLRLQIEKGQLAQSHLFVGPPSVGKAALARAMAAAVLAHDARDPSRAVSLVHKLKHPDLMWVSAIDGAVKVEQIRDVLHSLTLAPIEGRYRLAVIDDAHLASESSKNAILKTLEEPNPSSIIVMIAPSIDGVLPTITSRCQVLNLRPVSRQTLTQALVVRGVAAPQADLIARLARGCPGWAIRAIEDEEILAARSQHIADLESLLSVNRTRRFEYAEQLSKADDSSVQAILEQWLLYWLDVVRALGSNAPEQVLLNIDHAQTIARIATHLTLHEAVQTVRVLTNTLRYLQQNASTRLALDVLLLKFPVI
ncbi:MAG: hypothetical protein M1434_02995 [Chloroflexi bacterium]|nr:hypothetical protein [Chloroflexota bacterium]MCL5273695.1 hypothetical protein [Chloroflexota bacterium]